MIEIQGTIFDDVSLILRIENLKDHGVSELRNYQAKLAVRDSDGDHFYSRILTNVSADANILGILQALLDDLPDGSHTASHGPWIPGDYQTLSLGQISRGLGYSE